MVRGACFRTFALFAAANLQPPYGAALPRFHGVSRGETPERLTAERQVFAYPPPMQTVRQLAAGSLIFYTQFSILLFVSNEKLFEKILHEFCFLHADRNEEQFEMIEAVEKRDAPALSTSTGLFENIWY